MLEYVTMARILFTIKFLLVLSFIGFGQFSYAKEEKPMNLEDATSFIQKNSQGKILSAKTLHKNGVNTHRIKVITPSGRVKVFKVPSNNSTKQSNKRNFNKYRNQNSSHKPSQNRTKQKQVNINNIPMRNIPNTTQIPKGEIKRK